MMTVRFDQLRLATALGHTIPGLTLELGCCNGDTLVVANNRLDAQLTPCELRAAVLAPRRQGTPRLVDVIVTAEVRQGAVDLGGGLFARTGDTGDERWFATTLGHEAVDHLLDTCPLDIPDEAVHAVLAPDRRLGVTVVRITPTDRSSADRLDEIAAWALAACLVGELVEACRDEVNR